jgi:DNA replication protein DnaC
VEQRLKSPECGWFRSYDADLRSVIAVDLLLLDDLAIDTLDAPESRDIYDILIGCYRVGLIIVASNRGTHEWLATIAEPVLAQSGTDRLTRNAYDLVIKGASYPPPS